MNNVGKGNQFKSLNYTKNVFRHLNSYIMDRKGIYSKLFSLFSLNQIIFSVTEQAWKKKRKKRDPQNLPFANWC